MNTNRLKILIILFLNIFITVWCSYGYAQITPQAHTPSEQSTLAPTLQLRQPDIANTFLQSQALLQTKGLSGKNIISNLLAAILFASPLGFQSAELKKLEAYIALQEMFARIFYAKEMYKTLVLEIYVPMIKEKKGEKFPLISYIEKANDQKFMRALAACALLNEQLPITTQQEAKAILASVNFNDSDVYSIGLYAAAVALREHIRYETDKAEQDDDGGFLFMLPFAFGGSFGRISRSSGARYGLSPFGQSTLMALVTLAYLTIPSGSKLLDASPLELFMSLQENPDTSLELETLASSALADKSLAVQRKHSLYVLEKIVRDQNKPLGLRLLAAAGLSGADIDSVHRAYAVDFACAQMGNPRLPIGLRVLAATALVHDDIQIRLKTEARQFLTAVMQWPWAMEILEDAHKTIYSLLQKIKGADKNIAQKQALEDTLIGHLQSASPQQFTAFARTILDLGLHNLSVSTKTRFLNITQERMFEYIGSDNLDIRTQTLSIGFDNLDTLFPKKGAKKVFIENFMRINLGPEAPIETRRIMSRYVLSHYADIGGKLKDCSQHLHDEIVTLSLDIIINNIICLPLAQRLSDARLAFEHNDLFNQYDRLKSLLETFFQVSFGSDVPGKEQDAAARFLFEHYNEIISYAEGAFAFDPDVIEELETAAVNRMLHLVASGPVDQRLSDALAAFSRYELFRSLDLYESLFIAFFKANFGKKAPAAEQHTAARFLMEHYDTIINIYRKGFSDKTKVMDRIETAAVKHMLNLISTGPVEQRISDAYLAFSQYRLFYRLDLLEKLLEAFLEANLGSKVPEAEQDTAARFIFEHYDKIIGSPRTLFNFFSYPDVFERIEIAALKRMLCVIGRGPVNQRLKDTLLAFEHYSLFKSHDLTDELYGELVDANFSPEVTQAEKDAAAKFVIEYRHTIIFTPQTRYRPRSDTAEQIQKKALQQLLSGISSGSLEQRLSNALFAFNHIQLFFREDAIEDLYAVFVKHNLSESLPLNERLATARLVFENYYLCIQQHKRGKPWEPGYVKETRRQAIQAVLDSLGAKDALTRYYAAAIGIFYSTHMSSAQKKELLRKITKYRIDFRTVVNIQAVVFDKNARSQNAAPFNTLDHLLHAKQIINQSI